MLALKASFPIVTLTGPRQSGKTTLCRSTFPHFAYFNLEAPQTRRAAERGPPRLNRGGPPRKLHKFIGIRRIKLYEFIQNYKV